jgi:hypothetical protein
VRAGHGRSRAGNIANESLRLIRSSLEVRLAVSNRNDFSPFPSTSP